MSRTRKKLSDQMRDLIRKSGESRYEIAKATGISQGALSRFLSGERGLTTATLDILAEHLGWQLDSLRVRRAKR